MTTFGPADLEDPAGVAVDLTDNVLVSNSNVNQIALLDAAGVATPFSGTSIPGLVDGPGSSAEFDWPAAVAIDDAGVLYVGDSFNNCVRKITHKGNELTRHRRSFRRRSATDGDRRAHARPDPRSCKRPERANSDKHRRLRENPSQRPVRIARSRGFFRETSRSPPPETLRRRPVMPRARRVTDQAGEAAH